MSLFSEILGGVAASAITDDAVDRGIRLASIAIAALVLPYAEEGNELEGIADDIYAWVNGE